MRIAVVIERMEAWRGGAETSTGELARLLAARGHEIHFITTTNAPSSPDATVHPIRVGPALPPLRTAAFVRKATAFVKDHRFDVVHAISLLPCADAYQPRGGLLGEVLTRNVATRASRPGRAVKRVLMAMNFKQRSLIELERDVFRDGGPLILAVSQYVADQCRWYYGLGPPRVQVVFNGVATNSASPEEHAASRASVRAQYNVGADTLLLIFVAHNFRLKGLGPLIEAADRLARAGFREFRLLVAGRDNPVRYQRKVSSLGLDRFVTFVGQTQRMAAFFQAADVCVHPTYYDPCSRVVLEALCNGLPCITTRFNGACEVMEEGREGFILDAPDDVDGLAERIRQMSSPDLRGSMSEKAMLLREKISMARHVEELDGVFAEIAERKRRRCRSA